MSSIPPEQQAPPTPTSEVEWDLPPELVPDLDELVFDTEKPLESIFAEKQYRLLTEPLYSSWEGHPPGTPFTALANVGLFYKFKTPPVVPDVMLAVNVEPVTSLREKENRSYIMWVKGSPPDVVFELISDKTGGELGFKRDCYARIRVPYYVLYDPGNILLEGPTLQAFLLSGREYVGIDPAWLQDVGLGLTLWEGTYEDGNDLWVRWCRQDGSLITTGRELARQANEQARQANEQARQANEQADEQRQRVARLEAQLRELGIEPQK